MGIEGGMMGPITEAVSVTAAENADEYPARFMEGIRTDPMAAASATADPDIPAMNMLADDGHMGQTAPDVAHKAVGEVHQPLGDPAVVHEFAGEEEEGDGHERIVVQAGDEGLGKELPGDVRPEDDDGGEGDAQDPEYERYSEQAQEDHASDQDQFCHGLCLLAVQGAERPYRVQDNRHRPERCADHQRDEEPFHGEPAQGNVVVAARVSFTIWMPPQKRRPRRNSDNSTDEDCGDLP